MINNIHAVPRLLYMRPFKPYFHSGRVEGPDVAKIVRRSVPFLHVQSSVEQVVEEDFERATQYVQQFEEYRVVQCFSDNWNYEAYAQSQQTASFKAAVVNFKQDMAQLNKWQKDLERMKLSGAARAFEEGWPCTPPLLVGPLRATQGHLGGHLGQLGGPS